MSNQTDTESFIYGSGASSVESISAPDGAWDWQMLAHQQPHQQQYLQQQPQPQYQQQSSQRPQPQPQPQPFHCGMFEQLPDRSKADPFGSTTPALQVSVPWTQLMSESDPGQYDQDIHYNTKAAILGIGQQITSVSDMDFLGLLKTQSTSSRPDYGVVKHTTPKPKPDRGFDGRCSRCQRCASHKNRARRASQRPSDSGGRGKYETVHLTMGNSWTSDEKHCYAAARRIDEETQHLRLAHVMKMCGYRPRSREEYDSQSRTEQHATGEVQHKAASGVRLGDSTQSPSPEMCDDGAAPSSRERVDSVVTAPSDE